MGKLSRIATTRTCKSCNGVIYGTARELRDHANTCSRMGKIGLTVARTSLESAEVAAKVRRQKPSWG